MPDSDTSSFSNISHLGGTVADSPYVKLPVARLSRDTVLFITGLSGIIYETVSSGTEKPTLIIAFGAMLGLPLFIRHDELKKAEAPEPDPAPAEAGSADE